MLINTNISVRNNQAFLKDYLNLVYWLGGSTPASFVPQQLSQRRYTEKRIKMIQYVLRVINNNKNAFPSHESIARFAQCSVRAVINAFKIFKEDKLFEIDHRGDFYKTNIYKLGEFFKCRKVIYALRDVFSNLYRAFCRTLQHEYHDVITRNESRNSKTHFTLTTNVVVFGTNTNTTTFNIRKILHKVSSVFDKTRESCVLGFQKMRKIMQEKQEWIKSADGKTWLNKKKQEHATWGLSPDEKKMIQEPVKPAISLDYGKIKPNIMNERLSLCSQEQNLHRRLMMLEKLKTQVERASIPFIDVHIRKTKAKL